MGIAVMGKEVFPRCDELLPDTLAELAVGAGLLSSEGGGSETDAVSAEGLPPRIPVLCAGCPHRSSYYWLSQMKIPVAGDIGCYNLGCLPPFNAQHTMGCMGASVGVLHGMAIAGMPERAVATIGDSTFFHSGMPALVNMVHNRSRGVVLIMDNGTTAMTGHQDHPGTGWSLHEKQAPHVEIEAVVKALGVEKVRTVDAFDVEQVKEGLDDCLAFDGPSVLITKGLCAQLSKPKSATYVVNADQCIACGTCFKLGCPAIAKSEAVVDGTERAKAEIDPTQCVGCDMCLQVCPVQAIKAPSDAEGGADE